MRSPQRSDHASKLVKNIHRLINRFKSKKMIEARTDVEETYVEATTTPKTITTTMIIEDLDNGIDRDGIRTKYSLEKWEVAEMFKHPTLKVKKVKKARRLSFQFLDDTTTVNPNQTSILVDSTPAEDFHNHADLRTQDAINNSLT